MKLTSGIIFLFFIILIVACAPRMVGKLPYNLDSMDETTREAYIQSHRFLREGTRDIFPKGLIRHLRVDTIYIDAQKKHLDIHFNTIFAHIPFREDNTSAIYNAMHRYLKGRFDKYTFTLFALEQPIYQLIPNLYRSDPSKYDPARLPKSDPRVTPLVRNISKPIHSDKGLQNRHIAMWHSHGWYYEQKLDRWEWQRARVFQTVEDLLPGSFILPYLMPMLENAGATVLLPRERDLQTNEVIIENDTAADTSQYIERSKGPGGWQSGADFGFAPGRPPYRSGDNPFRMGSYRQIHADAEGSAQIEYIPEIPEDGEYWVSIAYAQSDSNITDAHYTVYHPGGKTEFLVNQQMGGGTWIYLGQFKFKKGKNPKIGRVVLSNESNESGKYVTADAVRFGGGMGNIERFGQISNRPRFVEAARYYLQYAGFPDTLVYNLNADSVDYNDDYQCRGEWVNYLKGAPYGPNRDREAEGMNIPVELSLAFHTDAGFTRNDTVIGTLAIYRSYGADTSRFFPDSVSRFVSRDLTDIIQTEIVNDLRARYDTIWTRRGIWDRGYSEAYRPNVPAMLLELLSHHNFLDMKFALDPRFRFDASRAIYKGMLKFLANRYRFDYVVQPLPVSHFQATLGVNNEINLRWQAVADTLEETANADKFIVYTRIDSAGFDNGILVEQPQYTLTNPEPGSIYSFRISAVNAGGESFPSEILSVCPMLTTKTPVLIINGFDRIAPAATLEKDNLLGFADFWDQGVPDKYDFNYIGRQYDYDGNSPWLDDDAPGHGASYGNYETRLIAGNTFDYPYLHGQSIKAAGYPFISVSDEVVADSLIDIKDYQTIDLILGEEKETPGPKDIFPRQFKTFPENLRRQIAGFCKNGGNIFVSGAYVGHDLWEYKDSTDMRFAAEILKYSFRTNYAVKKGEVYAIDSTFYPVRVPFQFNTEFNADMYNVEAPDAIEAADSTAYTIFRYGENNTSAAVASENDYKTVIWGFPFETVTGQQTRRRLMKAILDFFESDNRTGISFAPEKQMKHP